jgi:hypothetical protein
MQGPTNRTMCVNFCLSLIHYLGLTHSTHHLHSLAAVCTSSATRCAPKVCRMLAFPVIIIMRIHLLFNKKRAISTSLKNSVATIEKSLEWRVFALWTTVFRTRKQNVVQWPPPHKKGNRKTGRLNLRSQLNLLIEIIIYYVCYDQISQLFHTTGSKLKKYVAMVMNAYLLFAL